MPQKERRKDPRAKIVCPVIIGNNRNIISGETQDISAGGAYIKCRAPLRHPEVNMYISVSLLSPRIRAMGEVVRSDVLGSAKEGACYGIGIRFVAISDTDREIISSKVAELLKHKTSE
jgi:c-di-GMP-binding flagellar brake protein YcgR